VRNRKNPETLALAIKFATREMRGGLKGFRIFLACLVLGVAAIAGVGTLSSSITEGLTANGRVILGGDVDVRLIQRPATIDEYVWLSSWGTIAEVETTRAMVRVVENDKRTLSEVKAIDGKYPLFGAFTLAAEIEIEPVEKLLSEKNGLFGAVVEQGLIDRLSLQLGSQILIGELTLEVRGIIKSEPDKASQGMALGPRTIISSEALVQTELIQPGSLIRYHYRIDLNDDNTVADFRAAAAVDMPDAGWRIQDASNGAPGIKRFVDRVALFLTLVGLTALIVGGVGVGNAVRTYLDGKISTIATLKCLGASSSFIFRIHYLQVMFLAFVGSFVGLILGIGGAMFASGFLARALPVPPEISLQAGPLMLAIAYGLLTATLFAVWPLARARETPAASLFRDVVSRHRWPRARYLFVIAAAFLVMVALAIFSSQERYFAVGFVAAATCIFGVLILVGHAVQFVARKLPRSRIPTLRLAIANLYRPGAATTSVVLSMGLGLTLFVTVALIEGNLTRQVQEQLPEKAPAFFFIDILSDQLDDFVRTAEAVTGVSDVNHVPNMRGRIVSVRGIPSDQLASVAPDAKWALRGDRGLTYAATPPPGATVVEGSWWPEDYQGPPLISMGRDVALGLGLKLGDPIVVNVMGREIEAKIANFREIDWTTLAINFVIVFDQNTLSGAPHGHLATARADTEAEAALFRDVTNKFANISVIRMKEALETVSRILEQLSSAVSATSSITLVAGVLVLAGAFAAGHRKRVYDAVILKVLGATRKDIFKAFLLEYALLGLVTSVIGAAAGWTASYLVITQLLEAKWINLPMTVLATILISVAVTLVFGLLGSWNALGEKVAPVLRSD
jgi:putative ABC transport system permease protein